MSPALVFWCYRTEEWVGERCQHSRCRSIRQAHDPERFPEGIRTRDPRPALTTRFIDAMQNTTYAMQDMNITVNTASTNISEWLTQAWPQNATEAEEEEMPF